MQVEIIQSGRVLRRIDHNGETFIEAPLRGTYSIRLTNNCPRQRMAVISVDGINVVDGKDAGFAGQGYILGPWQTVDIKGWLRGPNEAAAFEFKASEASYAAGTGRGTKNTGVIGVAVFEGQEKRVEPPVKIIEQHHHHHHTYPVPTFKPWPTTPPMWWQGSPLDWTITTTTTSGALYGQASSAAYNAQTNPFPNATFNCSVTPDTPRSMDYSADSFNLNMVNDESFGAAPAAAACGFDDDDGFDDDSPKMGKSMRRSKGSNEKSFGGGLERNLLRSRSVESTKDLGTGYGNRVAMYTQEATFTRASDVPAMIITLRYAVREKLREWGVPVDTAIPAANPFPAASGYVAPPPGWRG
jgi:hypothetical protein